MFFGYFCSSPFVVLKWWFLTFFVNMEPPLFQHEKVFDLDPSLKIQQYNIDDAKTQSTSPEVRKIKVSNRVGTFTYILWEEIRIQDDSAWLKFF